MVSMHFLLTAPLEVLAQTAATRLSLAQLALMVILRLHNWARDPLERQGLQSQQQIPLPMAAMEQTISVFLRKQQAESMVSMQR
jgi:hypothetical protein